MNTGMRDSLGIVQPSGKPAGKPKTARSAGKSSKPRCGKVFVLLLVSRDSSAGKERLTWSSKVPHRWNEVIVDIYSCDHPQLGSSREHRESWRRR